MTRSQLQGDASCELEAREVAAGALPELQARVRRPRYFPNNYHDLAARRPGAPAAQLVQLRSPAFSFAPPATGLPLRRDGAYIRIRTHGPLKTQLYDYNMWVHGGNLNRCTVWHADAIATLPVCAERECTLQTGVPDVPVTARLHACSSGRLSAGVAAAAAWEPARAPAAAVRAQQGAPPRR